jgi:hypothetical protein
MGEGSVAYATAVDPLNGTAMVRGGGAGLLADGERADSAKVGAARAEVNGVGSLTRTVERASPR